MGAPLDKLENFKLLKKKKKKKTISRVGVTQMIGRANSYSKSKIFLVFDNYIEYNRFQFFFFARGRGGGGEDPCLWLLLDYLNINIHILN